MDQLHIIARGKLVPSSSVGSSGLNTNMGREEGKNKEYVISWRSELKLRPWKDTDATLAVIIAFLFPEPWCSACLFCLEHRATSCYSALPQRAVLTYKSQGNDLCFWMGTIACLLSLHPLEQLLLGTSSLNSYRHFDMTAFLTLTLSDF